MPYHRKDRPNYYFQCRTRTGWRQISTGTPLERQAQRIEMMWHDLAYEARAWDVLEPVLRGDMAIGTLFDLFRELKGNVPLMRLRLNDTDLEPLVQEFLDFHRGDVATDTLAHIEVHLRALFPAETPFLRSNVNAADLGKALAAYGSGKVSSGTRRKVHSSWSVFFAYLTLTKGLFARNPMEDVKRPKQRKPTPRFFEMETVDRIVGWQPTPERRAYFALVYGTGADVSDVLRITRGDIDTTRREVRMYGTKAHTRDRIGRIAAWAWPIVWEHASTVLSSARLFPDSWSRFTVSDWHREAMADLEISPRYPLKNARHHWAATHLRAGVPIAVVQAQLGHASAKFTLDTYGLFAPSGADRDAADLAVETHETQRRVSAHTSKNA